MDADAQADIKRKAEQYGPENLVVVLGLKDPEAIEISAITLTEGDPSWAESAPLTGVQLGLLVYSPLEPEIKNLVPKEIYEKQLGFTEIELGPEIIKKISQVLKTTRERWKDRNPPKRN